MKKNLITAGVVLAVLAGIVMLNQYEPQRMAEEHYEAEQKVQAALAEAEGTTSKSFAEAAKEMADDGMARAQAIQDAQKADIADVKADDYQVTFECSNGTIVIEVKGELSPLGAAQFRKAINDGVYDGARFFRVIPGFVAQFGIPGDPVKAAKWDKAMINDEPVKASNVRGTLSFAKSSQPNSRTTQLFINFGNNDGTGRFSNLDEMGFSVFARVVKGMDVVDSIFSGYGQKPDQGMIESRGTEYLESEFPKLDYVKKATIQPIPVAEEVEGDSDEAGDEGSEEDSEDV